MRGASAAGRSNAASRAAASALNSVMMRSPSNRSSPRPDSGALQRRDQPHRVDERVPRRTMRRQHLATGCGQRVIAPASLAGALHPSPLDPAAVLESIQQRVERGRLEPDLPVRALVDQLADLIAVTGAVLQQREDEQFGAALFELAVEARRYVLHNNILHNNSTGALAGESGGWCRAGWVRGTTLGPGVTAAGGGGAAPRGRCRAAASSPARERARSC